MQKTSQTILAIVIGMLATPLFAQSKPLEQQRRPPIADETSAGASSQKQPDYQYFSILNGTPKRFELHHDTEVGTGKPVDVNVLVIELQIMNSDGNLEPVGLQIFNFYTAKAQDPNTAPNPLNGRDCKIWSNIVSLELQHRRPHSKTWPYIEFLTAQGARMVQTNEDGPVWWSDDVECWASRDRFSPF